MYSALSFWKRQELMGVGEVSTTWGRRLHQCLSCVSKRAWSWGVWDTGLWFSSLEMLAAYNVGSPSGADSGTWWSTVQLHNTHSHIPRAVLSRSCISRAWRPISHTAFNGLRCAQHTDVCTWKSWPVLCVHKTPPILGSSWRTKLKILKLRQLLWLGPIYELPVEACCFKGRANPNWFRKSQGQGVNIIFQSALVVHAVFAVEREVKTRLLNNPLYQDNRGGREEHQANSNIHTLLLR